MVGVRTRPRWAGPNPLAVGGYVGSPLVGPAQLDGSDVWPIASSELTDPLRINLPRVLFPASYLTDNWWVSGPPADEVVVPLGPGVLPPLRVHRAVLLAQIDGDRQGASGGVLSGVLDTEELLDAFRISAAELDTGWCNPETFDSFAAVLHQAPDILVNGTQDQGKTCDGVSIGLGFEMVAASRGRSFLRPARRGSMPLTKMCRLSRFS